MIINKEKLIARLQKKTGVEAKQVEDYLHELINDIRRSTEQGKPYKIKGFGVFTTDNGILQFSPAEILKTEINNKYAGMKPIELIGAFKEPETGEMPEMTAGSGKEDEVWSFDESQAFVDEQSVPSEKETQPEEIVASEADNEAPSEEIPDKEADEEEPFREPVLAGEETTAGNMGGVPDDPEKAAPEKQEKDPLGRFVTVAVSILLIGVTGWLGYEFISENYTKGSDRALTEEAPPQEQVPSQPVSEVEDGDEQVDESPDEESSEPEELIQVINDEGSLSQSEQEPPYGVQGALNDSINSWYTVVVHSLKDADKAEDRKVQLEAEGYRVMINRVTVNGIAQYRVGVGQFPSIEEALEAAGELPEPYKSNNFIKRF